MINLRITFISTAIASISLIPVAQVNASIVVDTLSGEIIFRNDGQMTLSRRGKRGWGLKVRVQDVSQPSFMGISRSDWAYPIPGGFEGQQKVVKMSPTVLNDAKTDFKNKRGANNEWVE